MVLLEKSTSFHEPIRHIMTKFLQPVGAEPRTGIRPQEKGIGCKKSHDEPKVEDLRPQVQQLDDTLGQSQHWAYEQSQGVGARASELKLGASDIISLAT
jgi:hypothetical protein